jgi:ABC-type transporter Mla subunit MlaD
MTRPDPFAAAADVKRTTALLRDARSVVRRLDALALQAEALDDPGVVLIAEARATLEHLVGDLMRREQTRQLKAKEAVRRLR